MVKCEDCQEEMRDKHTTTCTIGKIKIKEKFYNRDSSYFDVNKRCHDCNIENIEGNFHHFRCDMERCPKCKGQLITCGCSD